MIDTDKYEPTRIDTLLHNTRAHSPDGWRELSKSLIELSDDDRLLIEYAPTLRAEVERLRKTNEFHMMLDAEETKEQLKLQKENDNLTKLCIERYAEVQRLREAIADVANNMEAADPSLLRSFIKDLLEVIE